VSLLSGLSNGLSLLNALSAWPDELINSLVSGVPQTSPFLPSGPTPVYGPSTAAPGQTPTVSQFLNAANAAYALGTAPAGLRPFIVNGQQMSVTDTTDGMAARVWITSTNQVVIAYSGTSDGDNVAFDPAILPFEFSDDTTLLEGGTPSSMPDALAFTKQVEAAAAAQGITSSNVFVTGHSLGADYAEYVCQQTGLGGIGFEGTGITKSPGAAGTGSNFVSVVTYGDPFASYASDVQGEQPYAPAYAPGQAGALPHYGELVMIGAPSDASALPTTAMLPNTGVAGFLNAALNVGFNPVWYQYHFPATTAHDLGVTLTTSDVFFGAVAAIEASSTSAGPVFNVANDTIPQLISAYGKFG
jgi:hypothetical protein